MKNKEQKPKRLLKYLKNVDHKNYVLLAIFIVTITLTLLFKFDAYIRLFQSFKGLGKSFINLFNFKPEIPGVDQPIAPVQYDLTIPSSLKEIIYIFKAYAIVLFNRDYFVFVSYDFINILVNLLKIAIWFPFLFIVWLLVKIVVLRPRDNEEYEESNNLSRYKSFEDKIINPIANYLEDWRLFLKYDAAIYKILFIILMLIFYRIAAMGVDVIAWYLYFIKTFKLASMGPLLTSILIDLIIFFLEYHIIFTIVPVIILLLYIRHRSAKTYLLRMQDYNRIEQSSHGVSNMISGPPGTGKTELMTALSFLANEELINNALEKLKKFSKMFKDFPWPILEEYIRLGIKERTFVNRAQLGEKLKKLFLDAFEETKTEEEQNAFAYTFNYDPLFQKNYHFDGIKYISLGEAIATYAEAFFLYDSRKPLHHSNYSVVHHYRVNGHFPLYNFNTIMMDKEETVENIAHIIKFDAHRLYNKLGGEILEDDDSFLMDGQIETITEIDKERGNKTTQSGQKMDQLDANQINDGFNDSIKTIRHEYTIDGTPFVKIYNDTQRPFSVNADLRETNEGRIEIQTRSDKEVALPFFELDYLFLGFITNHIDNYLLEFRSLRNDGTLYNYLLNKLSARAGNRLQSLYNLYSYSKLSYKYRRNVSSESAGDGSNRVFYMINQVTRANNYATDAYSEYFKSERLKANKGFYDAPQYKTYRASVQEIDAQGSYWGSKLKAMTKTVVEDEDDHE